MERKEKSVDRLKAGLEREQRRKKQKQKKFLRAFAAFLTLALFACGVLWMRKSGIDGTQNGPTVRTFTETAGETSAGRQETPEGGTEEPETQGETEAAPEEARVTARIHVIDVGQGSGMLIESGGEAMLVDGGYSGAASRTVAYLKAHGVTKLKYLLATHYDSDHLYGAIGALEAFPVETVLAPDYAVAESCYSSFMRHLENKGLTPRHPVPGDVFTLGDCSFTIYAPNGRNYEEENDWSLAFRLTDGKNSLLCTGDAELKSETEMLLHNLTRPLKSDIYIVGHHGSLSSSSAGFLKLVDPDYAVISCGRNNDYGLPKKTTVENLKRMKTALFRTDVQGDIICLFTGDGIVWGQEPCNDYTPG